MSKTLAALISLVPLLAAAQPSPEPPPLASWQPRVDQFFAESLKDPYSAKIRRSSEIWSGEFRTSNSWGKKVPAWAVCYAVNAKNSYGAYTGEQVYVFLFNEHGTLIEATPNGRYSRTRTGPASEAAFARSTCAGGPPLADPEPGPTP